MVLPLSGFTAIPNPYMVPFMGLQSYVIGIMFGMGFQGGKRKISAMTNDEFNALDIHKFAFDEMHGILKNIPSVEQMFAEMRPMVDIMARELGILIRSLPDLIETVVTEPAPQGGASLPPPGIPGFLTPVIGIPNPEQTLGGGGVPPPPAPISPFVGPVGPLPGPPTQKQLLDKYANWQTYRQNGGLLTEQQWRVARRGREGGIPELTPEQRSRVPKQADKIFHPQFFRQMKSLQNNRNALIKQQVVLEAAERKVFNEFQRVDVQKTKIRLGIQLRDIRRKLLNVKNSINLVQKTMNEFNAKFKATK